MMKMKVVSQSRRFFSSVSQQVAARMLAFACSLFLFAGSAHGQRIVQTYFVPFGEDEVHLALNTIDDFDGQIGSELRSTISIVAGVTNTVIYWDHWEDGYEASVLSPTQSTTQIWGDLNPSNGIPPGYSTDEVDAGDIITLLNDISVPRDPATVTYDGRDKFSVTRWVAVSRAMYAVDPGEVLAGSAQVYDKGQFGFFFRAPVGINVGTNQMFEYSTMLIQAGHDATVVNIDADNDGSYETTTYLNQGEIYEARFVSLGARVNCSKPVQCHMITGDIDSSYKYEMRWFTLFPGRAWGDSYYTPVGGSSVPSEVYLYNPQTNSLTIQYRTFSSTGSVTVAANDVGMYSMPEGSGGTFYTTNGQAFVPVQASDAGQGEHENRAYDWGHGMVSDKTLTSMTLVPWGPGSGGSPITLNGNPVWVTAISNTTLYVDYDADPTTGPLVDPTGRRYDLSTNAVPMETIKIFDPDNDQTGMRIYTLDDSPFTTAWGQDPDTAPSGNPYLDMGSAILPFPTVPAVKEAGLYIDLNTNGVANPGDGLLFSIVVENIGFSDSEDVIVFDRGASNTAYLASSTFLNGTNISDDVVPPSGTAFPLDEDGFNIGGLDVGATAMVQYVVIIDDPFPTNSSGVINGVFIDEETTVFVPVPQYGFELTKSSTPTNPVYIGETISYTIDVEATGTVDQTSVRVTDSLSGDLAWVADSTEVYVPGYFEGSVRDEFNTHEEYSGTDGALLWLEDWQEQGESDGPDSGDIQVMVDGGAPGSVYMLRIQNASQGAYRLADLSQFTNAVLSFDYRRDGMEAGDYVGVYASANGGSSWSLLDQLGGAATDGTYSYTNYDITAYASTNTAIRFYGAGSLSSGDRVWFDNVDIEVQGTGVTNRGGPPPTLIDGYNIGSNDTLSITFDAIVQDSLSVSQVVNTAYVTSYESPEPLDASVTNRAILPTAEEISGYVRYDTDGDGDLGDADAGISNVTVSLFSDPNGDGDPSDGALLETTTTEDTGQFTFEGYLADDYIILETDPANHWSTADSDGGNFNLIAIDTAFPDPADSYADSVDPLTTGLIVNPANAVGSVDSSSATIVTNAGQALVLDLGAGEEGTGNLDIYYSGLVASAFPKIDFLAADNTVLASRSAVLAVGSGQHVERIVYTNAPVPYRKVRLNSSPESLYLVDAVVTHPTMDAIPSTNSVFLDATVADITGQVRTDADGDGNLGDSDVGLSGVTISLYTDPNGDGDYSDGSLLSTDLTDSTGAYSFVAIDIGHYVLEETDPGSFLSTMDSDGTNDNQIAVYMPGARDSQTNDFLDSVSGLSITKSASPAGIWWPTLEVTYSIVVENTGVVAHTGVEVTDLMSDGISYAADSTLILLEVESTNTFRDDFDVVSYSNNDGSENWAGSWVETDSQGGGASGGAVQITGGQLRLTDGVTGEPAIYRIAELPGVTVAHLSFDYDTSPGVESGDEINLQISSDGSAWTTLDTFDGEISGYTNYEISAYISTNTYVRFIVAANYGGASEYFYVDNLELTASDLSVMASNDGTPPDLVTNATLASGASMLITFTGVVGEAVSAVTNEACLYSPGLGDSLCDMVVNSVDTTAVPDRIGGQVRFDRDGDGDVSDMDSGLPVVTVKIYTDPNGDGDPADGVLLDTTATDGQGYYLFGGLIADDYVVVETDLPGYQSTGDSDGGNANWIAVNLPGGVDSTMNDFLDTTISGLLIEKSIDEMTAIDPGQRVTYTVVVTNYQALVASGVTVMDPLGEGLDYVPNSTWLKGDASPIVDTWRDEFLSSDYDLQAGTQDWDTDWDESGDDDSPLYGDILVYSDFGDARLRVRDDNNAVSRQADISGYSSAELSLYYRRQGLEWGEYVSLEIRTNSSASWVELDQFGNDGSSSTSDGSYNYTNYNITPYISGTTMIRLRTPAGGMGNGDTVYFDDIQIEATAGGALSTTGGPPPVLAEDLSIAAQGTLIITYTATVGFVDEVLNEVCVTTSSDTNGLCTAVTSGVASVSMTQGLASVDGILDSVCVAWTAFTEDQEVIKEYDVLCADDAWTGWNPSLTDQWAWASTVTNSFFVDTGAPDRPSPFNLGKRMRFYRAAREGAWKMNHQVRIASPQVYVAKCIGLEEGENWVSLMMTPDTNSVACILGTNTLPAGSELSTSTRVEWYGATAGGAATNIIWLSDAGLWLHDVGGNANEARLPLQEGFNIVTPPGSGKRQLVVVGRVPTSVSPEQGHSISIAPSGMYNVVSYNLPYRVRLGDSGLREAGFTGAPQGQLVNPNNSDELRILARGPGSLGAPKARILMDQNNQFVFWRGGSGSAEDYRLNVDDALIIYTRRSSNAINWNVSLPYPVPTKTMDP